MDMQQFIGFANRWHPGFASRVRPVDDVLLEEVIAESHNPLPQIYLEYLTTMGAEAAELENNKWSLDPVEIIDHLSTWAAFPRRRFSMIAHHHASPIEPIMHWYLDHAADCAIVKFEDVGPAAFDEHRIVQLYTSFDELLLHWGARTFCFDDLPFTRELQFMLDQDGGEGRAICIDIAMRLGFRAALPPTRGLWLGERGGDGGSDAALLCKALLAGEATTFFVTVAAKDERELVGVAEVLLDNLAS